MIAPLALLAVLVVEATAAGLPPADTALLASQIQSESSWRPDVCSPAGACGLTQFMPATWREVVEGTECEGEPRTNPVCAVRAQIRYMARQERFVAKRVEPETRRDRIALALSSYNGGAGWVLRESRACGQRRGCRPGTWPSHVQAVCLRSEAACRENKAYPGRIMARVEARIGRGRASFEAGSDGGWSAGFTF